MLKTSLMRIAAGLLAAAGVAFPQTATAPAAAPLSFEVASIKPSGPLDRAAIVSGKAHIGTSVDKARVDIGMTSLMALICQAYKVKPYQVTGGADWLNTQRFDILAKLPEGASQDQVPEMLQTLLAERFKLALHRDKKETPVYALVVGKGGPKLKEALPDEPAPPAADPGAAPSGAPSRPESAAAAPAPARGEIVVGSGDNQVSVKRSGNGITVNSKDTGPMQVSMDNGVIHMEAGKMTMEMLTVTLSQYLDRPVVDLTELKGKYQVALDLTVADAMRMAAKAGVNVPMAMARPAPGASDLPADAASDSSGSSLFTSVQQLGLKLDARKLPYEFIVIDHVEKTPTEN
jgi:uncharacterized protein (TIGR03435 family)